MIMGFGERRAGGPTARDRDLSKILKDAEAAAQARISSEEIRKVVDLDDEIRQLVKNDVEADRFGKRREPMVEYQDMFDELKQMVARLEQDYTELQAGVERAGEVKNAVVALVQRACTSFMDQKNAQEELVAIYRAEVDGMKTRMMEVINAKNAPATGDGRAVNANNDGGVQVKIPEHGEVGEVDPLESFAKGEPLRIEPDNTDNIGIEFEPITEDYKGVPAGKIGKTRRTPT